LSILSLEEFYLPADVVEDVSSSSNRLRLNKAMIITFLDYPAISGNDTCFFSYYLYERSYRKETVKHFMEISQ